MADQKDHQIIDVLYAHVEARSQIKELLQLLEQAKTNVAGLDKTILQFMSDNKKDKMAVYLEGTNTIVVYYLENYKAEGPLLRMDGPIPMLS